MNTVTHKHKESRPVAGRRMRLLLLSSVLALAALMLLSATASAASRILVQSTERLAVYGTPGYDSVWISERANATWWPQYNVQVNAGAGIDAGEGCMAQSNNLVWCLGPDSSSSPELVAYLYETGDYLNNQSSLWGYIYGGDGADTIKTDASAWIDGGNGGDQIEVNGRNHAMWLWWGNIVVGGAGRDYIRGSAYNDIIVGGPGRDDMRAKGGVDIIDARDGVKDLTVRCGGGVDYFWAGPNDPLSGCENPL